MGGEEIRQTYRDLAEVLNRVGLGWVVEQVEETIRAGREVETRTNIFREEEDGKDDVPFLKFKERRAGRATVLMRVEAWEESERLHLLINGLRSAIVDSAATEKELLQLLRKAGGVETVLFGPDDQAGERGSLTLTGVDDIKIQELARLLEQLKGEVGA